MELVNRNIIFRCDSSFKIGTGHIFRTINIAKELKKYHSNIYFFCKNHLGNINDILKKDFELIELPLNNSESNEKPIDNNNLYQSWLENSQEQDAADFIKGVKKLKIKDISWIIIDHYSLNEKWIKIVKEELKSIHNKLPKFIFIDDILRKNLGSEIIINYSSTNEVLRDKYELKKHNNKTFLLGPNFSILEKNYSLLQKSARIRKHLRNILIFFGGIDQDNFTEIAIEVLKDKVFSDISIDTVIGKHCPHKETIKEIIKNRPKCNLHIDIPSLDRLVFNADLAIGGCGTHSWERVTLGLPSIVIPVAENQSPISDFMLKNSAAIIIDPNSDIRKNFKKELLSLLGDSSLLSSMSESAFRITDGLGVYRLIFFIKEFQVNLVPRLSLKSDIYTYFRWVNDPIVRQNSFKKNKITFSEHKEWFHKKLLCKNTLLFIMDTDEGLPIGQIRFERRNNKEDSAKVSISIDEFARGKGFAIKVLRLGLEEVQPKWPKVRKFFAEVEFFNNKSSKAFISEGFNEVESKKRGRRVFLKKL